MNYETLVRVRGNYIFIEKINNTLFNFSESKNKVKQMSYNHDDLLSLLINEKEMKNDIKKDSENSFRIINEKTTEIRKKEENVICEMFRNIHANTSNFFATTQMKIMGAILAVKLIIICICIWLIVRCCKDRAIQRSYLSRWNNSSRQEKN